MIYWIFACETTYPICVKWYGKFYPASSVFSLAWLLVFTKSFEWLVCHVVGLFTCKQTSACRPVVKFYCHHDLQSLRIYMWKLTWNPMWSVCENNVWISSMWNSGCFAILNTCESPCETPCEVYENMCEFKWGFTCESLCETPCEVYVKICVKGMTLLHTLFTHISLCKISHACEISVWNACEKCVKNVWKTCEKSVKIGHFFTRFSHGVSHRYS